MPKKTKTASETDSGNFAFQFTKEMPDVFLATLPDNNSLTKDARKVLSSMFVTALEQDNAPKHIIELAKKFYFDCYGMYAECFE